METEKEAIMHLKITHTKNHNLNVETVTYMVEMNYLVKYTMANAVQLILKNLLSKYVFLFSKQTQIP